MALAPEKQLSLAQLKYEVAKEARNSFTLYFAPVIAIAEVIKDRLKEINERAHHRPEYGITFFDPPPTKKRRKKAVGRR